MDKRVMNVSVEENWGRGSGIEHNTFRSALLRTIFILLVLLFTIGICCLKEVFKNHNHDFPNVVN